MAWDDDAYYETELEIPSGRYGKLIAMPGGVGPAGPVGPEGPVGPVGPPGDNGDGYAPLGPDGLVPEEYLPPSANLMAELTDVTPVGLAVGTAVDAKAGRTALVAERDFHFNVKDYGAVGNGVTVDNAGIAAALAAAKAAGGGIVFLPAGTYLVNQPLLMNGNNVTIQGAGRSASIIKTTGDHAILDVQNASGVTVRDLQVLGDGDVAKVLQRGIQCQNTTDSLFTNVWAKNLGYDGFCILWGNVNCTVSNCRASGCQDDGINVGGGTTSETIGTVVVGNIVTDCLHVGIHISDRSSFSTVTGNTVAGCDKGIDTYQSAATTGLGSNTITGNTIRNCVTYGIFIRVSDRNIVAGNSVEGGDTGIFLDNSKDCTITGNIITNTKTYGLRANSACNDLIFADNKLVGTNTTSFVECPRTQFNGNNMRGAVNSVRVSATGVSSVVSNNVITNGTGIDIQIDAAGCVVSGNRIDALGTKSVWAAGSSARCVVTGNVISGGARGIEVASADGLVTGNSLSGQTAMGIYTYGARTQIADNHLWSTQLPFNMFNATDALIVNNVTVATVGANSVTENGGSGTILSNNRLDKPASLLGTAPIEIPLTQTPVYTVSNVTTDRAFDANATTIEELADVVGTLISDLRARGVVPKIQAGVFGPVAVDPDAPAEATPETPESNK